MISFIVRFVIKINVKFYILLHKNFIDLLFACAYRLGTEYAAVRNGQRKGASYEKCSHLRPFQCTRTE